MLVLDVDDTLYLENDYVLSGFEAVNRFLLRKSGIVGFIEVASKLHSEGVRGNVINRTLNELGMPDSEILVQELVQVYREHDPKIELTPDARRFLFDNQILHPMGVITGGPVESQSRKIRALGLEGTLDPIIYAGMWGQEFDKPNARAWVEFISSVGSEIAEFTYIGDNPIKDFPSSRSLGWTFVRMRRPGSLHFDQLTPEGVIEVSDFDDILSLLANGALKL